MKTCFSEGKLTKQLGTPPPPPPTILPKRTPLFLKNFLMTPLPPLCPNKPKKPP